MRRELARALAAASGVPGRVLVLLGGDRAGSLPAPPSGPLLPDPSAASSSVLDGGTPSGVSGDGSGALVPTQVEITGVAPGPLLDALNRAEDLARLGIFSGVLVGGFIVLLLAWIAIQGMRR